VDIQVDSKVFDKNIASIFSAEDGRSMFVPKAGCLHTGSHRVNATQETSVKIFTA
jgi:hypothetical protein